MACREIHGDTHPSRIRMNRAESGRVKRGATDHEATDIDDQIGFLCHRNEPARQHHAVLWMRPADQGLGPAHMTSHEIDDGLVHQIEFATLQREPEIGLEIDALRHARAHFARIALHAPAASVLGTVHRHVSVRQQRLHILPIRRPRNADARAHEHFALVQPEGPVQRLLNTQRGGIGFVVMTEILEQHGEFITAKARHRISGAQHALQPLRYCDQEGVTFRMSERVIDELEVIQVEHQQRNA